MRVEFAGTEASPDNELNGIAFQAVGRGGTYDYVQVHMNKDDGVEFFGGTADAKHLVLTSAGDDSLDWTYGWQGRVQFVAVARAGDDGDFGIEADNNDLNNELLPRAAPVYNATFCSDPCTGIRVSSCGGPTARRPPFACSDRCSRRRTGGSRCSATSSTERLAGARGGEARVGSVRSRT